MYVSLSSRNVENFQKYGIQYLTGEACAYSHRILCDLNEDGVKLISDYLGLRTEAFFRNWNSSVNGKPATASIMMPRGIWNDLAKFILLHVEKCPYIADLNTSTWGDGWCGFDDEALEQYDFLREVDIHRNWSLGTSQPSVNGRNVHAFSGRTN